MIYFIKYEDYIKIGYSKDPSNRIQNIQTGLPGPIEVLCITKGNFKKENLLHRKFSRFKSRGEWFRSCDELNSYINTLDDEKVTHGYGGDFEKITMPVRRMYIDSGLTHEDAAIKIGLTKGGIQKMLERATQGRITIYSFMKLASAFGYKFEYRLKKLK